MNDKGHFYISLAKSGIRILGCIFAATIKNNGIEILASSFLAAEFLGIAEEIFDNR